MNQTRVIVADGLAVFRAAVRTVLEREKDFRVREAADKDELAAHLAHGCVDVVLIDLALPPRGGVDAVRDIAAHCAGRTEIIAWTFNPRREIVSAAVRAGANGFLHKEITPEGLVRALRGIHRGEAPIPRELMSLVIDALHELEATRHAKERSDVLSGREREVLSYLARGARNKQIASTLTISEFTVKRHVQNILHKLGLSTRREAAAFYRAAVIREEELAHP